MDLKTIEQQCTGKATALLHYLRDPEVTDLLVNGTRSIYIERKGILSLVENPFETEDQIRNWIERLIIPINKSLDAKAPYIDGRLLDGSRFHIILPPLTGNGPCISIRKKKKMHLSSLDSFSHIEVIDWLKEQVITKKNILISGSTGSGKTTLLTRLLELIPACERIIVIEESKEIEIDHPHFISLEGRPPSPDGIGEVSLRSLLKNALRMRPDRVVVGECRSEEAFDMLQAMNTGHSGSFGTVHASSCLDALRRLESLALLGGTAIPHFVVREWIGANVQVVVFLQKVNGVRRIGEMIELHGLEGDRYRITPLYHKLLKGY